MTERPTATPPQEKPEQPPSAPPKEDVVLAVGVQHRNAGDIYTFVTDIADLQIGQHVVVEGEHGESVGMIVISPHEVLRDEVPKNVRSVVRRANDEDMQGHYQRREQAREFFELCDQKIIAHGLPMKLIDAEVVEGGKKVIFFFFAEQRIDFRGLVKDLASTVHKYIEMRQIGSRDASSFLGCMGPCGRMTCCSLYLRQFQSISISMAKNQGLSPNPAKLTGMCGKLKCCLAYENKAYSEQKKDLPKQNSWVETPRGVGKVAKLDVLRRECWVKLESGGEVRCPCADCRPTESRGQEQKRATKQQRQEGKGTSRKKRAAEEHESEG